MPAYVPLLLIAGEFTSFQGACLSMFNFVFALQMAEYLCIQVLQESVSVQESMFAKRLQPCKTQIETMNRALQTFINLQENDKATACAFVEIKRSQESTQSSSDKGM